MVNRNKQKMYNWFSLLAHQGWSDGRGGQLSKIDDR